MKTNQLSSIDRFVRQQGDIHEQHRHMQLVQHERELRQTQRHHHLQQYENNQPLNHSSASSSAADDDDDDDDNFQNEEHDIDWSSSPCSRSNPSNNGNRFSSIDNRPSTSTTTSTNAKMIQNRTRIGLLAARPPFRTHSMKQVSAGANIKHTRSSDFVIWSRDEKVFDERDSNAKFQSLAQSFSHDPSDDHHHKMKKMKKSNNDQQQNKGGSTPRPATADNSNSKNRINTDDVATTLFFKSFMKEVSQAPSEVEKRRIQEEEKQEAEKRRREREQLGYQQHLVHSKNKNNIKHHTFVNNFFEYEGEIDDGTNTCLASMQMTATNKQLHHQRLRRAKKYIETVSLTGPPVPHGRGTLRLKDGTTLEGIFVRGELTCSDGIKKWASGTVYRGSFVNGEPHGQGTLLSSATGDRYQGEFAAGYYHGKGNLVFRTTEIHNISNNSNKTQNKNHDDKNISLNRYTGEFRNNKFHGRGTLVQSLNESILRAVFRDGMPSGTCHVEFRRAGDSLTIREFPSSSDDDIHNKNKNNIKSDNQERNLLLHVDSFFSAKTGVTYSGPMYRVMMMKSSPISSQKLKSTTTTNDDENPCSSSYFNYNSNFTAIINTTSNLHRCLIPQTLEIEDIEINGSSEVPSSSSSSSTTNSSKSSAILILHSIIKYIVLRARSEFALERIEQLKNLLRDTVYNNNKQDDGEQQQGDDNNSGSPKSNRKKGNLPSSPAKKGKETANKKGSKSTTTNNSNNKSSSSSSSLDEESLMLLSNIISPSDPVTYLDLFQLQWDGAASTNKDNQNQQNHFQTDTMTSSMNKRRSSSGDAATTKDEDEEQQKQLMTMSTLMSSSVMMLNPGSPQQQQQANNNINSKTSGTNKNFAAATSVFQKSKIPSVSGSPSPSSSPAASNWRNQQQQQSSQEMSIMNKKRNTAFLDWLFKNVCDKTCGKFSMHQQQQKTNKMLMMPTGIAGDRTQQQAVEKEQQDRECAIWLQESFPRVGIRFRIGTTHLPEQILNERKQRHELLIGDPLRQVQQQQQSQQQQSAFAHRPLSSSSSSIHSASILSSSLVSPPRVLVKTPSEMLSSSSHQHKNKYIAAIRSPPSSPLLPSSQQQQQQSLSTDELISQDVLQAVVDDPEAFLPSTTSPLTTTTQITSNLLSSSSVASRSMCTIETVKETGRLFELRVFRVNTSLIQQSISETAAASNNSKLSDLKRTTELIQKVLRVSSGDHNSSHEEEEEEEDSSSLWEDELLERGYLQPVPLLDTRLAMTSTDIDDNDDDDDDDDIFNDNKSPCSPKTNTTPGNRSSQQQQQQQFTLFDKECLGKTVRDFIFMKEDEEAKFLKKRSEEMAEARRSAREERQRRRSSATMKPEQQQQQQQSDSASKNTNNNNNNTSSLDSSPQSTARSARKQVSFLDNNINKNKEAEESMNKQLVFDDDDDDDDDEQDEDDENENIITQGNGSKKKDDDPLNRFPVWNHTRYPVIGQKQSFTMKNIVSRNGVLNVNFVPLFYRSFAQDEYNNNNDKNNSLMSQQNNNHSDSQSLNNNIHHVKQATTPRTRRSTSANFLQRRQQIDPEQFFVPVDQNQFIIQIRASCCNHDEEGQSKQQERDIDDNDDVNLLTGAKRNDNHYHHQSSSAPLVQIIPGKDDSCKKLSKICFEKRIKMNIVLR